MGDAIIFQGQCKQEGRNSGGCLLGTGTKRLFWKILSLLWAWNLWLGILYGPSQLETSLIQFGFFSPPVSFKNLENNKENHDFLRFFSRLIRILHRRKSTLSVFELKVKRVVRNFSVSNFATDSKTQISGKFMMRPKGGSRKFRKRWPEHLPAI